MDPTRLDDLLADPLAGVTLLADGMTVRAAAAWVVPGEDHLSYTTLTRLVECCREHHWARDVLPAAQGEPIEAIARSFSARFYQAAPVGVVIRLSYQVCAVRSRMYQLRVVIADPKQRITYARCALDCVFYDPLSHRACRATPAVVAHLKRLETQDDRKSDQPV